MANQSHCFEPIGSLCSSHAVLFTCETSSPRVGGYMPLMQILKSCFVSVYSELIDPIPTLSAPLLPTRSTNQTKPYRRKRIKLKRPNAVVSFCPVCRNVCWGRPVVFYVSKRVIVRKNENMW